MILQMEVNKFFPLRCARNLNDLSLLTDLLLYISHLDAVLAKVCRSLRKLALQFCNGIIIMKKFSYACCLNVLCIFSSLVCGKLSET